MRKPRRRKPRQKPVLQMPVMETQSGSTNNLVTKRGRPSVTAILGVLVAILGIGAALATLWPRISVEHSGTLADPASIVFYTIVNSYIPLRYPSFGIIVCDLAYGTKPPTIPPSSCPRPFGDNMPHSPPYPNKGWLFRRKSRYQARRLLSCHKHSNLQSEYDSDCWFLPLVYSVPI
jgi:hypothetical protein